MKEILKTGCNNETVKKKDIDAHGQLKNETKASEKVVTTCCELQFSQKRKRPKKDRFIEVEYEPHSLHARGGENFRVEVPTPILKKKKGMPATELDSD